MIFSLYLGVRTYKTNSGCKTKETKRQNSTGKENNNLQHKEKSARILHLKVNPILT